MIQEFKDFISKGDVIMLAVAFVIATAFSAVVTAFVDGVIMNIIAAIFGKPDFSSLSFDLGDGRINYGLFLTAAANFAIIAAALFVVLKALKKIPEEDTGPSDSDLLAEIAANTRR